MILDLFAGPGGWDTGLRMAGYTGPLLGIEHDIVACRTAMAAGHDRVQADVATFPIRAVPGTVTGLIASPPCQAWSMAGDRKGLLDQRAVFERIAAYAAGREPRHVEWADPRSALTAEPMRYVVVLRPWWIALEQVPPVLPLWQYMAELLRARGYRTWTGILGAEEFGVPQTRKRAILIASLDGPVGPPAPTHQPYRAGREYDSEPTLFGDPLPPPLSMADALGWGLPERPAWTVTAGGTDSGGAEVFGNAKCRAELAAIVLRNGNQANACTRRADEPAGTLFFGQRTNAVDWVTGRPSTTVCGDARIAPPGHRDREGGELQFTEGTVRVTVQEAGILQSFPADYPWQGTKSQQYRQVGDAVPPLLAMHILRPLIIPAAADHAA